MYIGAHERTPAMPPLLLDRRGAAVLLGVSASTLDRLAREGTLHPVRLRRRVMYRRADLEQHVASLGGGNGVGGAPA